MEALGLDQVRFVVAREQPFKHGRHAATAAERAEMVALAIEGDEHFAVERAELERQGPSYTVDTLRQLRAREPGAEYALLVGADAAAELPTWREGAEIPRLARVVAFARAGAPAPAGPHVWRTVAVPAIDISATAVRDRVRTRRPIRYWVPDAVASYIAAKQLYLGAR